MSHNSKALKADLFFNIISNESVKILSVCDEHGLQLHWSIIYAKIRLKAEILIQKSSIFAFEY